MLFWKGPGALVITSYQRVVLPRQDRRSARMALMFVPGYVTKHYHFVQLDLGGFPFPGSSVKFSPLGLTALAPWEATQNLASTPSPMP